MPRDAQARHRSGRPHEVLTDRLALLAVLCSGTVYRIVANDGIRPAWQLAGIVVVEVLVVLAFTWWVRRSERPPIEEAAQTSILVVLACGTFAFHLLARWFGIGQPWEMVLISTVRTLMFGLAVFGTTPRLQRLAMFIGVCIVVFSVSLTRTTSPGWGLAIFSLLAITWLTLQDWKRFSDRLLDAEAVAPKKRWVLLLVPCVALFLVTFTLADERALSRVQGWFPSSGGEGDSDPFARDGIGDGNALVPGEKNIKSIAPLEDAPFLLDDRPSLYDTFDDTYEPVQPVQKTQKAVSLDPSEAERGCERVARSERGSREFSTVRKNGDGGKHRLDDLPSDAQFHIAGRVPLHLRTQVYDLFDGLDWYPREPEEFRRAPFIREHDGKPWLQIGQRSAEWFADPETHVLKIIRYGSPIIPTPLHVTGVHIDRIDREDMFRWEQQDIPALDREEMPPLIPIRIASKTVHHDRVPGPVKTVGPGVNWALQQPDVSDMAIVRELAHEWTRDAEEGWGEVHAILNKLRSEYRHDRSVIFSDADRMPVLRFLTETHAGPDYLFATAAAMMLREKGYPCRVVAGFYASPEKYDNESKLTSVFDDDVHFWVEMYAGVGTWITVEPTPGYEVLEPARSWSEVLAGSFVSVWRFIIGHPLGSGLVVALCGLAFWFRIPLRDVSGTLACRLLPLTPQRRLTMLFGLLERRLDWIDHGRPAHRSPRRWWQTMGIDDPHLDRLHDLIDARMFGDADVPLAATEVDLLCRELLGRHTRSRLRAQFSVPDLPSTAPLLTISPS